MFTVHKRLIHKADGRHLYLYSRQAQTLPLQATLDSLTTPANSHLRWHPFRQEWVCYAAHRQDRTFQPPANYCPLCPTQPQGVATEIPVSEFEVAVFDNRFPAFQLQAAPLPEVCVPTRAAIGHCEVMVYTPRHEGSLGLLSQAHLELVVQVWVDRYQALMAQDIIQFVMPFENRGAVVGVTLPHPHGQIYAFADVPPVVQRMQEAFQLQPGLQSLRQAMGEQYDVFTDDQVVAFVPPFQRYPYEVWLTTHHFHPGPWTFTQREVASLAHALGHMVRLYDHLFEQPCPYIMLLYAAPKKADSYFQFHLQFLPFSRTANKIKFLAGCETGAGTFLADMLPEQSAEQLRQKSITLKNRC